MKRLAAIACTALMLVGGAACSKKETKDVNTTATTVARDESSTATTSRPSTDTTSKSDSDESATDTTLERNRADSGDGGCPTAAEAKEIKDTFEGFDPTAPGNDAAALMAKVNESLEMMKKYLPSSLHGDLETVTSALTDLLTAVSGVDMTNPASISPEKLAELQAASAKMQAPEVEKAMDNISNYFKTNCPDIGLDLD